MCYYEKEVLNERTNKIETKLVEAKIELGVTLPEAQLVFVKENGQFLGTDQTTYNIYVRVTDKMENDVVDKFEKTGLLKM